VNLDGDESLHSVGAEGMRTTGVALMGNALTTALGFGVLIFSPLAPMLVLWALYQSWRTGEATTDTKPIIHAAAPIVIGGNASAGGAMILCPKCLTGTLAPATISGIICPNRSCIYAADKPVFSTADP
jgi:hypothetical protein